MIPATESESKPAPAATGQAEKPAPAKDWRSTLGMFSGDALMKEIDEEGRRIREAEAKAQHDAAA